MRLAWILLPFALLCGCSTMLHQPRIVAPELAYGQAPDPFLACTLLRASRCAYAIDKDGKLDPSSKEYAACSSTWSEKKVLSDDGLRLNALLVAAGPDAVIVSYRGTLAPARHADNKRVLKDWVQDADYEPVTEPFIPGRVHHGFLTTVNATFDDLVMTLRQWQERGLLEGKKLYVTGHSKGGAAAPIAAVRLQAAGFTPDAVYTFAAARSGDKAFSKSFERTPYRVWRYENHYDVVPHLPPNSEDGVLVKILIHDSSVHTQEEYEPVGALMFVNWFGHLTATYGDLAADRLARFAAIVEDADIADQVVAAHSSAAHGQYDEAVCAKFPEAP
jgi:Lipase (class 3)